MDQERIDPVLAVGVVAAGQLPDPAELDQTGLRVEVGAAHHDLAARARVSRRDLRILQKFRGTAPTASQVNAVSDASPKGTIVISLAPSDRLPPSAVLAL
jgi:hypothetical protein